MRLIAVVADTHVPTRANEVPEELLQDLERHEPYKIFHAGDLVDAAVIDAFAFIAPTEAVKGNNDAADLPHEYAETFHDVTVAMRHKPDFHDIDQFADRHDADIVVYGHTHTPKTGERDGYVTVNPGSPTVGKQRKRTYALISIEGHQHEIEIREIGD